MWRFQFKNKMQLGLDLDTGTHQLYAVLANNVEGEPQILDHFYKEFEKGEEKQILAQMKKKFAGKSKSVVACLPAIETIWKLIEYDTSIRKHEIDLHLKKQPASFLGTDLSYLAMDYHQLPIENKDHARQTWRIIAAYKEKVNELMFLMKKAGLHLCAVDIDVFAFVRAAYAQYHALFTLRQAMILIKKKTLVFCIVENGCVMFAETLNLNSNINLVFTYAHMIRNYQLIFPSKNIEQLVVINSGNDFCLEEKKLQETLNVPLLSIENKFLIAEGLALWRDDA